jgi:putative ABC transport system substrate-binding protein
MRRREFIALVGGAAVASPNVVARAQQLKLPEIGFLFGASREAASPFLPGLRRALMEAGYAEGQNVAIEACTRRRAGSPSGSCHHIDRRHPLH